MFKKRWGTFIIITVAICALCYWYQGFRSPEGMLSAQPDEDDSSRGQGTVQAAVSFPGAETTLYQMDLYLEIETQTLYGKTVLTTINTSGQVLDELWFTCYPNAFKSPGNTPAPSNAYYEGFDPGWLKIDHITVNQQQVEFFEEGISLQVLLPADLMPGEKVTVEMQWKEKIPHLAYRYGCKDGTYMLGNFYPVLNLRDSEGWHNTYNCDFGDPFCFSCATYLVRINIPDNHQLAFTGSTVASFTEDDGREVHLVQAENVRDFCLVVLCGYQKYSQSGGQVTVHCYTPWESRGGVEQIAAQSTDILQFYSCRWGSYPYPDFKVVFVPMEGFHGMEYSGLIFMRQDYIKPLAYQADERGMFILAHEIAHQWWYGMVGNDQTREPWLDEGLANWSAYQYLNYSGSGVTVSGSSYQPDGNLACELGEIVSRQEYYRKAYNGGEAFWFGLEEQLGTEAVDKVLRRYLAEYRFKMATTSDLKEVIKKEAHQDMSSYFDRWFEGDNTKR